MTNRSEEKAKIEEYFSSYKKEMKYLKNFTDKTLKCYQDVFNRWQRFIGEIPSELNLNQFIIGMRESGISDVTVNISIRCLCPCGLAAEVRNTSTPCRVAARTQRFTFRISEFGGMDGSDLTGILFAGGPAPGQFVLQIDDVVLSQPKLHLSIEFIRYQLGTEDVLA
jgi:hypothetical protein